MNRGIWAIVAILMLTGCGKDTPEKFTKDKLSYFDEITGIIEEVTDGGSASDAADEIKKLGAKAAKFAERQKELIGSGAEVDIEAAAAFAKEYGPRAGEAIAEMTSAMARLDTSGRATEELTKAITEISSK